MRSVDVTLNLKDNLTSVLRGVVGQGTKDIDRLQSSLNKLKAPTSLGTIQTPNITGSVMAGNLLSDAIGGIASGVTQAGAKLIGAIGGMFNDADRTSGQQASASSVVSTLLDVSYDKAKDVMEGVSKEISILAAKLPGSTSDYMEALGGLSDTLALGGSLTTKGLDGLGTNLVKNSVLLAKSSDKPVQLVATELGKLFDSNSTATLFKNDTFQNSPVIKGAIEKTLKAQGKSLDDFFKLGMNDRMKIFDTALKPVFNDQRLKEMAESASSQIDTAMSALFDPTVGAFGMLRKFKVGGIDTTLFSEVNKTVGSLIEMMTAFGNLILPGGTDGFMAAMVHSIRGVGAWAKSVSTALGGNWMSDSLTWIGQGGFGKLFNNALQSGLTNLNTLLSNALGGEGITVAVASITQALISGGIAAASQIQVSLPIIGETLFLGFAAIGQVAIGVLMGVAGYVGSWLGGQLTAGINAIGNAFTGMGSAIAGAIGGVVNGAVEAVGSIGNALTSLLNSVRDKITGLWGELSSAVSGGLANVGSAIMPKYSGQNLHLLNSGTFTGTSQHDRIRTAANGNLLEAMDTERRMMPSGSSLVIANSSELIVPQSKIPDLLTRPNPAPQLTFNITSNNIREVLQQVETALVGATRQPTLSMV